MRLLFGRSVSPDLDLDDPDLLGEHLKRAVLFPADEFELTLLQVLATQILEADPPLVWETAQRLNARGLGRRQAVMERLRAIGPGVQAMVGGSSEDSKERYATSLRALPIASEMDIERAVKEMRFPSERILLDELQETVLEEFGDVELFGDVRALIQSVVDRMLDDGQIELLAGDVVVDPAQLCRSINLTTRMSAGSEWPPLDSDFAGLSCFTDEVEDPADALPGQLVRGHLRNSVIVVLLAV